MHLSACNLCLRRRKVGKRALETGRDLTRKANERRGIEFEGEDEPREI